MFIYAHLPYHIMLYHEGNFIFNYTFQILYQAENAIFSIIRFATKYYPPSRPQQSAFEVSLVIQTDWCTGHFTFLLLMALHNVTGNMLSPVPPKSSYQIT
jgi:hypothetical protein